VERPRGIRPSCPRTARGGNDDPAPLGVQFYFILEPGLLEEWFGDADALGIADPYNAGFHKSIVDTLDLQCNHAPSRGEASNWNWGDQTWEEMQFTAFLYSLSSAPTKAGSRLDP
jgi:hypothetical protein